MNSIVTVPVDALAQLFAVHSTVTMLMKQWRHRWFGTPSRTLWITVMILKILKLFFLACVESLPSNSTNYFSEQWLRHWLDGYAPSHCRNQWWFEIIDIHHLCEHEFHDDHPIALPLRAGCGVRIMKSVSKCDAFLSLYWRVKGGPRLVDMPGARWPATHSWHSGITSWSSCPGLWTSPIISYIFLILHYYMMLPSNGNICRRWWPFVMGPPVTGWFPSQWLVTQSFDLHCACGCSGPTGAKPFTDTQLLTKIVLSRLSVSTVLW